MNILRSTFAAALIASASFSGVALAEGDYYEGAAKAQAATQAESNIDSIRTGSIDRVRADSDNRRDGQMIFPRTSRDNR